MLTSHLTFNPTVYHGAVTKTVFAVGNLDDEDVCGEDVTEEETSDNISPEVSRSNKHEGRARL